MNAERRGMNENRTRDRCAPSNHHSSFIIHHFPSLVIHPLRRRAFSLLEMLIVIGLFTAFAVVASELMHRTIRVGHDAGYAQLTATTFDAAGRAMRQDVWSARDIALKNDRSLMLTLGDGTTVDWTVDDAGTFTRAAKNALPQRWQIHAAGATFASNGSTLIVRFPRTKMTCAGGGEVRLTSQLLLAGRMTS